MIIKALLLSLILPFLTSSPAYAHTLKRDGSIGAVLHVAPNDDPRTNEPAEIGFSVSDSARKFRADDCTCQLTVIENDKASAPITLSGSLTTTYIFKNTGLYTLRLEGSSSTGSFTSFSIDQSLRVSQVGGTDTWALSGVVKAILLGALMLVSFSGTVYFYRRLNPHNANHKGGST